MIFSDPAAGAKRKETAVKPSIAVFSGTCQRIAAKGMKKTDATTKDSFDSILDNKIPK